MTDIKNNVEQKFPTIKILFLKIAEPRNVRIILFIKYIFLTIAGWGIVMLPPESFQNALGGRVLVMLFGYFVMVGGLITTFAVLPGIWWLERSGLILLGSGFLMYLVILSGLDASIIVTSITIAIMLTFLRRYVEIKDAQLAPGEV